MINNSRGMTEAEFLDNYDISQFDQPSVTVDILLLTISEIEEENYRKVPEKSLRVLLIKRKEHPFIGQWALPGGFIRMEEDLQSAAYRELREETGVDNAYLEQLYTYGDVKRDPRGRIISTAYMSLVNAAEVHMKAGSDAEETKWFEVKYNKIKEESEHTDKGYIYNQYIEIILKEKDTVLKSIIKVSKIVEGRHIAYERSIESSEGISFDHGLIIQYGIERLRNKLEHSDMVFHMMPDLFTLTALQKTYEEILDKKLLKANFRRKVSKMVTETDFINTDGGHRPSKFFKFNTKWDID